MSGRREHPFVAINCGGIREELLQSELFGHAKGAFTGAIEERNGKLRQAEDGTVFLDEIAELTGTMQSALLRVLQNQKFEPLGKDKEIHANVRVIAATNVDLEEAVRQKTFRHDLFYRLNVLVIRVPPLRERRQDIPLLAAHFLKKHAKRRVTGIAPEAMDAMMSFDWPGNVRELENVIQAATVIGKSEVIRLEDLPERVRDVSGCEPKPDAERQRDSAQPQAKAQTSINEKPPATTPGDTFRKIGQRAARQAQKAAIESRLKVNGRDIPEAARWGHVSKQYVYKLLSEDL
jgi:DNA-binding NtrC family response regulator